MIFVTVGNDFRGFDRLLREMDRLVPRIPAEIVIQKGYSRYLPTNTRYFDFISMQSAAEYMRRSKLVVSHAGIGTIILCKEYGVPILIFPRRKSYGEHMNDHQMEIAQALSERESENIYVAYKENELEEKILNILKQGSKSYPFENDGRVQLIRTLKEFIKTI